jgi:shikimate dehydrogenase
VRPYSISKTMSTHIPASSLQPPISSRTKTIAIIGDPIEHSITPRIQNFALRAVGADIVNVAFRVAPENLESAVLGAKALGLLGLMVTIPHKERVLALCDELDNSARLMGAANLLHFRADGKTVGYSSDGWAAVKSLEEEGVLVKNSRICILGGGGAARSLALTFALEGATEITLLNRTVSRAQTIADEVASHGVTCHASALDENTLQATIENSDFLVNSTSVGMHPHEDDSPAPMRVLTSRCAVYDIVYNPLETRLLREARAAGAKAIDGLGMLIYTNIFAVQTLANLETSPQLMREEALRVLSERH